MGFWAKLFNLQPKTSFKEVDWLDIETKLRSLELQAKSTAQTDMKQVLIQADILVDTIMKQAGIPGTTFGERLKNLKGKLPGPIYHKLWQAHIKRNELVHEHGSFVADWEKTTHLEAFRNAISTMRGIR